MLKILNEAWRLLAMFLLVLAVVIGVMGILVAPIWIGLTLKQSGYSDLVAFPSIPLGYLAFYVLGRALGLISDWSEGLECLDLKKS